MKNVSRILLVVSVVMALVSCGSNDNTTLEVEEVKEPTSLVVVFTMAGDTLEVAELTNFWMDGAYVHGTRVDGTEFYTTLPVFIEY